MRKSRHLRCNAERRLHAKTPGRKENLDDDSGKTGTFKHGDLTPWTKPFVSLRVVLIASLGRPLILLSLSPFPCLKPTHKLPLIN